MYVLGNVPSYVELVRPHEILLESGGHVHRISAAEIAYHLFVILACEIRLVREMFRRPIYAYVGNPLPIFGTSQVLDFSEWFPRFRRPRKIVCTVSIVSFVHAARCFGIVGRCFGIRTADCEVCRIPRPRSFLADYPDTHIRNGQAFVRIHGLGQIEYGIPFMGRCGQAQNI